jgi:hypothetical protein
MKKMTPNTDFYPIEVSAGDVRRGNFRRKRFSVNPEVTGFRNAVMLRESL